MYTKKIYFSGGDFHELQEVFQDLPGVTETKTGYINADDNANFNDIACGKVKGYMGIEVTFNPKKTDISKLMDVLFAVVNPYVSDGQGNARGELVRRVLERGTGTEAGNVIRKQPRFFRFPRRADIQEG